ncbi:mevalonate kinase-like protein [Phycomyces nitens]|nr:mevalonate kinase-like protein [Phycomyces nitens]
MTIAQTSPAQSFVSPKKLLVSAPGKVILFGEHAVVYQKTAVAASLGLRSYLYLEQRQDGQCQVLLPNVGIDKTWAIKDIPTGQAHIDNDDTHPMSMPNELKTRLTVLMGSVTDVSQESALMAFLYLLVILGPAQSSGFTLCMRSFVPVGAGLGSSASYSVVLATSLLILFGHLPHDFATSANREVYLNKVNKYAFKAEQVIHGNPSGVDNAVATFGGAKSFIKGQGFSTLEGFTSLRLLLTNTRVPRSTSALVAGVGAKRARYPEVIDPILDSIDKVSLRCRDALKKCESKELSRAQLVQELELENQDLVDINHCLLNALGVSHTSLETVRSITGEHGLKTKLTGAGGGGCAVTILGEDTQQVTIDTVVKSLGAKGYDCYQTLVGGVGAKATELTTKDCSWLLNASRDTLESYV